MKRSNLALIRQYSAAATASISVIILGTALGWPSPVLLRIQETGYPFPLTSSEISWMVSVLYIGNFLSPIPAGYCMDRFGRKKSLVFLCTIPFTSWIIIYFANQSYHLYIARFFSGTWSGIVSTVTPMYLAEISEPRIRGALSTFVQLMTNLGVVLEYVIGPVVSYDALAMISGSLPVIFVLIFTWIPESPYWLIMKGQKEEAAKALSWFRGTNEESIADELNTMEHHVMLEMRNKGTFKDLVKTKGNRKALLISEALAILQRMSGISALMAYTSTTLPPQGAGSLTPNDCVIVMGMVWVVSVFIATVLVDSLGRRPLLLMSTTGCGIGMFCAGLWFFLNDNTSVDVSEYYWIPFASFIVYGLSFCIGLGPIASTVQGEVFPSNIKGLASGVTSVGLALTSFGMNKIYHPIAESAGMFLNYWIFSGSCVFASLFIIFVVVETKGKTLYEIQERLNRSKKNKNVVPVSETVKENSGV